MKRLLLLNLLFLNTVIICSEEIKEPLYRKKYMVFDDAYYQKIKKALTEKPQEGLYYYQKINHDLCFNIVFIANKNHLSNYITIDAQDIAKRQDYVDKREQLKKLANVVMIKEKKINEKIELFFSLIFENNFSDSEFQIFKGCLSYAFENEKNVVVDQSFMKILINYANAGSERLAEFIKNQKETQRLLRALGNVLEISPNVQMPKNKFLENFNDVALKSNIPTITLHVLLNLANQDELFDLIYILLLHKKNETTENFAVKVSALKKFLTTTQTLDEMVLRFNEMYQEFLGALSEEIIEEKIEQEALTPMISLRNITGMFVDSKKTAGKIGTILFADQLRSIEDPKVRSSLWENKGKVDLLSGYGFQAIQVYSAWHALKNIGSLRSFPQIPQTKFGKAKALFGIYSIGTLSYELYKSARSGLEWAKEKIYGKQEQKPEERHEMQ